MKAAFDSAAGRLVSIRLAYLAGTAFTLLWAPTPGRAPGDLVLQTFQRWDSRWFVRIVEHGYATRQTAAFFPVYPLLVRAVAWVVRNDVAAAMLVSVAAAAVSAWLLERIARRHLSRDGARTAVLLLALYPLAFVFTAAYSDALFLLFVLVSVDAAERGRPLLAGAAGALAVDTRLLGLALVPALAILLWPRARSAGAALRLVPLLLLPLALVPWLAYLHAHFGDALAFSHAEERYWQRQSPSPAALWHELRMLEIHVSNLTLHLPSPPPGSTYPQYIPPAAKSVGDMAALVAGAVLSGVAWRRLGAAFGAYSFATLAIVVAAPTTFQPLVSLPRFLLADFPVFLALAALLEGRPRAREAVVAGFAALGAVAAVGFAHGVGVA